MINLVSAATSVPKNAFRTSELVGSLMHKLSPELINTIGALGVEQRYSVLDNYRTSSRANQNKQPALLLNSALQLRAAVFMSGAAIPIASVCSWRLPTHRIKCCRVWPPRSWARHTDCFPARCARSVCKRKGVLYC